MGWSDRTLALFYLGPPTMVLLAVVLVCRWVRRARKARELEALDSRAGIEALRERLSITAHQLEVELVERGRVLELRLEPRRVFPPPSGGKTLCFGRAVAGPPPPEAGPPPTREPSGLLPAFAGSRGVRFATSEHESRRELRTASARFG